MVYALLSDEMAVEGGIHALQLRTMTPDEEVKHQLRMKEKNMTVVEVSESTEGRKQDA